MKQTQMIRCTLAVLMMALLPLSCTDMENPSVAPDASSSTAPVYYFSIPATIGNGAGTKAVTLGENTATSAFAETDKVYVFIEGQEGTYEGKLAFGYDFEAEELTSLTLGNIHGATCDLSGALTFYYYDDGDGDFKPFVPAVDDVVHLFYNMNEPDLDNPVYSYYDYGDQNGDKDLIEEFGEGEVVFGASHYDFAQAKMKVTGVVGNMGSGYALTLGQYDDPSKSNVHFDNIGSMFRQRLAFTNETGDEIDIPTITKFIVNTSNDQVIEDYYPFSTDDDYYEPLIIEYPYIDDGDIYFALMFNDENKNDDLVLTAYDEDGNVYSVTKPAPSGGFQNGKYYYSAKANTLAWQKCIKPTVTGTSATPNLWGEYTIPEDPVNLTISGNSEGYCFTLEHGGTVTLDNLNATSAYATFIYQYVDPAEDISLVLTGTNIISTHEQRVITVDGGSKLKLSCTGSSAILTVTATLDWNCGIYCDNYFPNNNYHSTTTELDVTALLAAEGYSVVRSARTKNDDGSYTWTYTVRKLGKFSVSGTKQVYFSPGNLQYQASTTTWRFAEHQYDFVGGTEDGDPYGNVYAGGNRCDNTLIASDYTGWIDLFGWGTSGYNNKYPYMTSTTSSDYADGTYDISETEYDWGVHNSIGTYAAGTWRTPTHDEWVYLLNTDGSSGRSDTYRFARGKVHSVNGLIIFPDGFDPDAADVTISNPNEVGVDPTTYSDADWAKMETAGCVFLPNTGTRENKEVIFVEDFFSSSFYWSSTHYNNNTAYVFNFNKKTYVNPSYIGHGYCNGEAVRLVRDVPVAP